MSPPSSNTGTPKRLLIIDDEANMRHMLAALLQKSGYQVDTASDGAEAVNLVDQTLYDFILCDLKMPGMGGMEFIDSARDKLWESTVIMMSAFGTLDTAVEAMKKGAYDFISKPFKPDEVLLTLKKAEERESLKRENRWLKERIRKIQQSYSFGTMVGRSPVIQAVFRLAEKVAFYDTTVLITGESGTGKELIARGIHAKGDRSGNALVPVNCGGIPENLLESELFGYKRGAFTGADRDKMGLFEAANGGTIFLDEIGELPLSLQVKLLRVLQEDEIRRVGDAATRKIDVRVIAATARDLEKAVAEGVFREDLYYRLNVVQIRVPPLREWPEDIALLCRHFINLFNEKFGKEIKGVSTAALKILQRHHWPGNIRELENVIERSVVLSDDPVLMPEHFPPELGRSRPEMGIESFFDGYSLKEAQRTFEHHLIVKALQETGGNRTQAAKLLEISHPSLLSKMKLYGIDL